MGRTTNHGLFASRVGLYALAIAALLSAVGVPISVAAESVEVPMAAVELPSEVVRPTTAVVIGKLEPSRLWLPDTEASLPSTLLPPSDVPAAEAMPLPKPRDEEGQRRPPLGAGAAVFELSAREMASCTSSRRFREAAYLAATLLADIDRIVVAAGRDGAACGDLVVKRLAADGHRAVDLVSLPDELRGVRVRLELRGSESKSTEPSSPLPQAATSPPSEKSTPRADQKLRLLIDGESVVVQEDGWFVFVAERSAPVSVVVSRAGQVLATSNTMPLLLRDGLNPAYANARFDGVELKGDPRATPRISFRPSLRAAQESLLAVSLPLVVKVGIGYTALLPVPDEEARDRPTVEAAIRTHPLFENTFLSAAVTVSSKAASKVPLAFVGLLTASRDLLFIRDNLSVPVGLGVRVFRATLKSDDEAPDPSLGAKRVAIPTNVLGPAAQAGVRYRTGLLQIDLSLVVAPIKAADSPVITTIDGALTLGYQISPEDTIVLGSKRHDVRYPTVGEPAKVVAASVILGYERDLY